MVLVVATFYQFVSFADYADFREPLRDICQTQNIKGTILLAPEGLNGTIAGSRAGIDTVLSFIRSHPCFGALEAKKSAAKTWPFDRMKVRLKREIVTLGQPEVNPCDRTGIYVDPQDWNALITDPTVTVIDTRNDYEVAIGTFQGAQNPHTQSFRHFPDYVAQNLDPAHHSKVAMFCTGGIRCEKATAYLLQQGFAEVYHLKGGILKYLETIEEADSLWQGECFIFDERVAIGHGLKEGHYALCRDCGHPVPMIAQASNTDGMEGICPSCLDRPIPFG
ncbi:MAG: rhodanese-related sulfurtransferase [Thermosynechococcaceae cyanobacterium]